MSLVVYLIHPMMIVLTRLFAKLFLMQNLFVENSMIHYLTVCLASIVFGMAAVSLRNRRRPKQEEKESSDRAYVEIDLHQLEHNVRVLQSVMPDGCHMMAVVKAEAYGYGAFAISSQQTLIDFDYANLLNRQGFSLKVQIKIDTGMHRLGMDWKDILKVKIIFAMKNFQICGIYTHLCCAESMRPLDAAYTGRQIENFYSLLETLQEEGGFTISGLIVYGCKPIYRV